MIRVEIKPNESLEKALRNFTKICDKAGILSELKKRRYYEKPSSKRKIAKNIAIRKQQDEDKLSRSKI